MIGAPPRLARLLALAACALMPLPATAEDGARAERDAERSAAMIHRLATAPGAGANTEAQTVLLGMAVLGHAPSQYLLGIMHRGGGMVPDGAQAVKWLSRAAEQGHAEARAHLARMATRGDAAAHRTLGLIYRDGAGTARDEIAALGHLRAAAVSGDPQALFALGKLYWSGGAVEPDEARATVLFRAAAEQAMAAVRRSQRGALTGILGSDSESWMGVAIARTRAEHASRPGSDAGRAELYARYWVGLTFLVGAGVAADAAKAIAHHCFAAERGFPLAEFGLGLLYARGHGVPHDPGKARRWFARAAAHDHPHAAARLDTMTAAGAGEPANGAERRLCQSNAVTH